MDLRSFRDWAGVSALAAVYFGTGRLGLMLDPVGGYATLVWPPSGIALATLLLFGFRFWPGVTAGAFLVNLVVGIDSPVKSPVLVACGIALGNTLEALAGAYLLRRRAGFRNELDRLQDVLALIILAALGSTTLSATVGVTSLVLGGVISSAVYSPTWLAWWVGDMLGELVVGSLLLSWATASRPRVSLPRVAEAGAIAILLVGIGVLVFSDLVKGTLHELPLAYLSFPPLIWAAVRFGPRGAATVTFALAAVAVVGTVLESGRVARPLLSEALLQVQLFASVVAVTALALAAAVAERAHSERRAEENAARFGTIFNQAVAGIAEIDLDGRFRLVNQRYCTITGRSPEELRGLRLQDLSHPEDLPYLREALERAVAGGPNFMIEQRQVRADGSPVWVSKSISVGRDERRRPQYIVAVVQDITERRQAEEALRQSELRQRTILESAIDALIVMDHEGRIVEFNRSAEKMFACSRADVLGKPLAEVIIPPSLRAAHYRGLEHFLATGEGPVLGKRLEMPALRSDGTEFPVELSIVRIPGSEPPLFTGFIRDITEHRQTQERFRLAVEAAPNGMVMVDPNGHMVLVNAELEKLFGYTRAELIGQPVEMLVPERFRANHPSHRSQYLAAPQVRAMGAGRDLFGLRKDGSEFPVEIGLNPLPSEAGTFVLASVIDITGRKRSEEQLRSSLSEKELLLKEIHHRVKNNLQVISSLLSLQARRLQDSQAVELFRESERRVLTMAIIHENLYQSEDLAHIDFADYVRDLTTSLMQSYGPLAEGIRLYPPSTHVTLGIDTAVPCGLLVNELVSNSLKHAFPGGRKGVIQIQVGEQDDGQVLIQVRDDGIGLPADVDLKQTHSLGMRLVHTLTNQLRGTLEIQRNGGTAFSIRFTPRRPPKGG